MGWDSSVWEGWPRAAFPDPCPGYARLTVPAGPWCHPESPEVGRTGRPEQGPGWQAKEGEGGTGRQPPQQAEKWDKAGDSVGPGLRLFLPLPLMILKQPSSLAAREASLRKQNCFLETLRGICSCCPAPTALQWGSGCRPAQLSSTHPHSLIHSYTSVTDSITHTHRHYSCISPIHTHSVTVRHMSPTNSQ